MAKWVPYRHSGDQTPIDARKFKHCIGTQEHWFCVHESLNYIGLRTVSDWASGYRVTDIPCATLAVCRGDTKKAARMALNQLLALHGESRVLSVLRGAPKR
jgi:hypothetical protein